MTEYSRSFSEMNLNYLIGFNKEWGDWSVGATLGGNRQRTINKMFYTTDGGRPFIVDGLWSVNNLSDKRSKKDYSEYRDELHIRYGGLRMEEPSVLEPDGT